MAAKHKQALFLKTKNIGDSIILTASIAALPKDYRYVDVICFPESKPIFQMHKRVRHIFVIPRDKKGIKKVAASDYGRSVRIRKSTVVHDVHGI